MTGRDVPPGLHRASAMTVSTVLAQGRPLPRVVLLGRYDAGRAGEHRLRERTLRAPGDGACTQGPRHP